jgi:uncharacterized metal-binding protein YceD (DUF177 family)
VAIKLNIGTLNDGSQQIELVSDAKEIGIDDRLLKGSLLINIDLFKASHQLDLKVKLSGIMTLACDRCLEVYEQPFGTDFEIVFVQKSEREEAINDDYIRSYSPFMKTVDITDDIREYFLLAVPMRKVPAETPEGVCTWCGKTEDYWKNLIQDEEK